MIETALDAATIATAEAFPKRRSGSTALGAETARNHRLETGKIVMDQKRTPFDLELRREGLAVTELAREELEIHALEHGTLGHDTDAVMLTEVIAKTEIEIGLRIGLRRAPPVTGTASLHRRRRRASIVMDTAHADGSMGEWDEAEFDHRLQYASAPKLRLNQTTGASPGDRSSGCASSCTATRTRRTGRRKSG